MEIPDDLRAREISTSLGDLLPDHHPTRALGSRAVMTPTKRYVKQAVTRIGAFGLHSAGMQHSQKTILSIVPLSVDGNDATRLQGKRVRLVYLKFPWSE